MASPLKLSVVICAFNEQDLIGRTLATLYDQERRADEVIVVDNNSTDDTAQIVQDFIWTHPDANLKLIHEPKQGLHHARESGWRASAGDVIFSSDADIRFPRKWLKRYEQAFNRMPDVAALTGPVRYYDALFFVNWLTYIFELGMRPEKLGKLATDHYWINGCNAGYRRTALEAVGGYHGKKKGELEDLLMAARLKEANLPIRWIKGNEIWNSFRRFNKDGWRGYKRWLFGYTIENVYSDHAEE